MSSEEFRLTVLGTRGSMPICGENYSIYGGNTSCYWVQAGEENIFLDAGTGLLKAPVEFPKPPVILLSHLHLDHILGLGVYPRLLHSELETYLLIPANEMECSLNILNSFYTPPFWPLNLEEYGSQLHIDQPLFPLQIGDVRVSCMSGNHPGSCLSYRLEWHGKTIVYMTDYEMEPLSFMKLSHFAADTDLLLFDAQYSPQEYERKKGFGHSTALSALKMMKSCRAKKILLIHHDPQSTDDILSAREKMLEIVHAHYAREGDTILL